MKNIWITILKPSEGLASWLVLGLLLSILGLGYFGQLETIKAYLSADNLVFGFGTVNLSLYDVIAASLIVILIFWLATIVSEFAATQLKRFSIINASNRALATKITQIAIYIIALLIALDFIGIDLTTLTIFSGALGIGLGFGLQKISSNFVSGLILLFEKSIEEGDLLELEDGTYGFIRKASARFTLIETFDGKEVLVPNEDLITSRVTNWTYSNPRGRVEVKIGVSYKSDIQEARRLILEAAREHPRCSVAVEPTCFLLNFGESSVDFTLHFWVDDVTEGRWEPQSDVMFSIWEKFKANNIQIPFPQRDLHLYHDSYQIFGTPDHDD
ncbi:MAG: mechanosensitive ion channel family protein [Pseudohongiellaceae bacterium]|jgi:small-conductance mechanosensitive channel